MSPLVAPTDAHARADSPDLRLVDVQEADPAVMAEADVTAWEIVLDRIELDVMRGERNLARGLEFRTDPWDLPDDDIGPLPPQLVDRAAGIHRRQHALIEKMSQTLHHTLRQQAVVEELTRVRDFAPKNGVDEHQVLLYHHDWVTPQTPYTSHRIPPSAPGAAVLPPVDNFFVAFLEV